MAHGATSVLIAASGGFLLCLSAPGQTNAAPPRRVTFGFELRGRLESDIGLKYTPGSDDTYYLHRLRIHAALESNRWLRLFVQAQDTHAPGFGRRPTPASYANTLDLRQGYVEIGRVDGESRLALRAGRQELRFGDARVIGPSNWNNGARTWDAIRLVLKPSPIKLDCFAAALVPFAAGKFDSPRLRNGVYGCDAGGAVRKSTADAYVFWKTNARVRGESGQSGDLDVYTTGTRVAGPLAPSWKYLVEMALQTGHYAGDRIRAWAGHWQVTRTLEAAWKPQLLLEYNHASGDADPHDRRRGTFDQLYPSNHDKYGTADRITWRNIHNLRTGAQLAPARKWILILDLHNFWLAKRADGLYTDSGTLIARNPAATSSYVGPEVDLQATCDVTTRLQIGLGFARLFAGGFLRQTIKESGSTYPYVMWTYRR